MNKKAKKSTPSHLQDYPDRLSILEKELHPYPNRESSERLLKNVQKPTIVTIAKEKAVHFKVGGKPYAVGHTNIIYAGSNHARGVRHIRFYADETIVLQIEGDFENQEFGLNFRFQNLTVYTPGDWEKDFILLSDELNEHIADRKTAFARKRAAEQKKRTHA